MAKMRNIIKSSAEYTEIFSNFRGIAAAGDTSNPSRLAYCENLYRDYDGENTGAIESIPGFRRLFDIHTTVNGFYAFLSKYVIVHSGNGLYQVVETDDPFTSDKRLIGSPADRPSHAFSFGTYLYLLDGESIFRIREVEEGICEAEVITDFYVPTLFVDGKPYEARNLLTDRATECFNVVDGRENAYESDGLRYSIIDRVNMLCAVSGYDKLESTAVNLFIPGYKVIDGVKYRVCEISDKAFYTCNMLQMVSIGEGVERIGTLAFYNCTGLKEVITPYSLKEIGASAFNYCTSLTDVYLRLGLSFIDSAAFTASLNIKYIHYEGSEEDFYKITGASLLDAYSKMYYNTTHSITVEFKLSASFSKITQVTVDGKSESHTVILTNGKPSSIVMYLDEHWMLNGSRIQVEGVLSELKSNFDGTLTEGSLSGKGVIQGCTVSELFDGRVFLTGNPELPATVFYCSRMKNGELSPLYFGEYNYFKDGTDEAPIVSLLSVRNTLAVFKREDDGMGGIFYHSGVDTENDFLPRIYPVTDVHSGTSCLGGTLARLDEAFFLSDTGLNVIERQSLSLERTISQRSGNVAALLAAEDLTGASIHEWMGYIAVCCGKRIYLADTRSSFIGARGNLEYEWFVIDGVGSNRNPSAPIKQKFRYADDVSLSYMKIKEDMIHEPVSGDVISGFIGSRSFFYVTENGVMYEVYPTGAQYTESFYPATKFITCANRLLFLAGSIIFVFNNDLRGKLPPEVNADDYPDVSRSIHSSYYAFDGMTPRYLLKTVKTNCGVPHLTKSTVSGSTTVKLGRTRAPWLRCEVGTDSGGEVEYPLVYSDWFDFLSLDFGNLTFEQERERTATVREREKGWTEKDITVYTDELVGPLVVYGIAFRYKIKGRIKTQIS